MCRPVTVAETEVVAHRFQIQAVGVLVAAAVPLKVAPAVLAPRAQPQGVRQAEAQEHWLCVTADTGSSAMCESSLRGLSRS